MKQQGFTLIELIVVIIILGVLSATALPKFVDLSGEAEVSATKGAASAVTSWGMSNFAAAKLGKTNAADITDGTNACTGTDSLIAAQKATDLSAGKAVVQGITLTTDATKEGEYTVSGGDIVKCAPGVTIECNITHYSNTDAVATAYIPCTN